MLEKPLPFPDLCEGPCRVLTLPEGMYVCTHTFIYMCVCMYVCMCLYVFMYVSMRGWGGSGSREIIV